MRSLPVLLSVCHQEVLAVWGLSAWEDLISEPTVFVQNFALVSKQIQKTRNTLMKNI